MSSKTLSRNGKVSCTNLNKMPLKNLRYIVVAGNLLFALWIFFNGMDEGFKATPVQLASYITLFTLLALNSFLIYPKKDK